LSASAAESRQRTESLCSSAMSSDPLPIRIMVGNRRLSDSTSRVQDSADGAPQQLNGNCDLAAEQRHIVNESSQSDAARTIRCNANGNNDLGTILDGLELASGINGDVYVHADGIECGQSLQTSPCSHSSDGSLTQNNVDVRSADDLVFIAAGHENALRTQQKHQRKDDGVVEPQTASDGRSTHIASVSAKHRVQTSCSSNAALVTSAKSRCAEAEQMRTLNHSSSDRFIDRHRPRRTSSNGAVDPATNAEWAEADENHAVDQPTSNRSTEHDDYDIIPSSAEFSTSSSAHIWDITMPLLPPCSRHLSAVDQRDVVSPSHSDGSQNDLVNVDTVRYNHLDCSDAIQPRNGIGRGQLLRMMLNNRQPSSNNV